MNHFTSDPKMQEIEAWLSRVEAQYRRREDRKLRQRVRRRKMRALLRRILKAIS